MREQTRRGLERRYQHTTVGYTESFARGGRELGLYVGPGKLPQKTAGKREETGTKLRTYESKFGMFWIAVKILEYLFI